MQDANAATPAKVINNFFIANPQNTLSVANLFFDRQRYAQDRRTWLCKEMSGGSQIKASSNDKTLQGKKSHHSISFSLSDPMSNIFEIIALLTGALYFGSTGYITLVEHPSRLALATEVAWSQWVQSVKSTPKYAASALIAAAAALIHGRASLLSPWTWGSVLLLAVLPFTVASLLPIQRRLINPDWPFHSDEVRRELKAWGNRHLVRTCLGFCAFALFIWAALKTG